MRLLILLMFVLGVACSSAEAQEGGPIVIEIPPDWNEVWAEAMSKAAADQQANAKSNIIKPGIILFDFPSAHQVEVDFVEARLRALLTLYKIWICPLRTDGALFQIGGTCWYYSLGGYPKPFKFFLGDRFWVIFADGTKIEAVFMGPTASPPFKLELSSSREADGRKFAQYRTAVRPTYRPIYPSWDAEWTVHDILNSSAEVRIDMWWATRYHWYMSLGSW